MKDNVGISIFIGAALILWGIVIIFKIRIPIFRILEICAAVFLVYFGVKMIAKK